MKYIILGILGASIGVGAAYYKHHGAVLKGGDAAPSLNMSETASTCAMQSTVQTELTSAAAQTPRQESKPQTTTQEVAVAQVSQPDLALTAKAVDCLLSSEPSYEQKRAIWNQLRESGGLDQAIADLQQRFTSNPGCAECAAVLGHAYLQKCRTVTDMRDQAVLAMDADKLFDMALASDPQNWEARFTKAVALSYWPDSMGKGAEVVQHFTTLIQQQEAQPQQSEFADSYLWLGDQYKKTGRLDDARSVWQRGAALFPGNQKLGERLVGP